MKEYDTLRTEILQRASHRFAFLTLLGGIGAYSLFIAKGLNIIQIFVLVLSAFVLLCVWYMHGNLIAKCSRRIAEIEEEINAMAGEKLMKWEHEKRGSILFHKLFR